MIFLLIGFLSMTLGASVVLGTINLAQTVGSVSSTNTPVEAEYAAVQLADAAAQAEVDKWVRENHALGDNGGGVSDTNLNRRIEERFEPVGRAYALFLSRHPDHARARLDYGNFLNERQDELGAQAQWEKALELDPKNPALYNNLAGRYSESGPAKKAFEFFTRAIDLNPSEPSYQHNFADTLYVLRKSAMTCYSLTEQQVYGKALEAYSNAARLDPRNFTYGWDWAQTFYALTPLPTDQALKAWTNVLALAGTEAEQESVSLHLARIKMLAGRLAEARAQLVPLTNPASATLKANLLRAIAERERAR